MENISVFGGVISIIASKTFPTGFTVTQFADDSDPLSFSPITIANVGMGVNGDMISWSSPAPVPVTINIIPGGVDNTNLQILADANRVGQGRVGADDIIQMTVVYPDGQTVILSNGKLTSDPVSAGMASSGRKTTRTYSFAFESKV